jgi:hypothetical protein
MVHMVVDGVGSFARTSIRRDRAVEGGAGLSRCIINVVTWRSAANLESAVQTDPVTNSQNFSVEEVQEKGFSNLVGEASKGKQCHQG